MSSSYWWDLAAWLALVGCYCAGTRGNTPGGVAAVLCCLAFTLALAKSGQAKKRGRGL